MTGANTNQEAWIADCWRAGRDSLECEANARLIAAAPELLRACQMVAEIAVAWQPLTPGDITEVKAAIAKALKVSR